MCAERPKGQKPSLLRPLANTTQQGCACVWVMHHAAAAHQRLTPALAVQFSLTPTHLFQVPLSCLLLGCPPPSTASVQLYFFFLLRKLTHLSRVTRHPSVARRISIPCLPLKSVTRPPEVALAGAPPSACTLAGALDLIRHRRRVPSDDAAPLQDGEFLHKHAGVDPPPFQPSLGLVFPFCLPHTRPPRCIYCSLTTPRRILTRPTSPPHPPASSKSQSASWPTRPRQLAPSLT